jgi:hypothetical protein
MNFMKAFGKSQMKYQTVGEVLRDVQVLLKRAGEKRGLRYALPSPVLFELVNPLARFSCFGGMRELAAKAVAESLYLLSGMNGGDFIREFRGEEDPGVKSYCDEYALGPALRFFDQKTETVLDYSRSNALRQKGTGFTDQLALAVDVFKKDESAKDTVIQFGSVRNSLDVHNVWLRQWNNKLEMTVTAGYVDAVTEMYCKILSPFAFLHQIISDLTGIPAGSLRFVIGGLYADYLPQLETGGGFSTPVINTHDFQYPKGGLTLRDVDTLISIVIEFASRLDENSLGRANPFEGDDRVLLWSDIAEVLRAWKAEKLGYKIAMEQNFYHPQLRFIYKGETL